MALGEGDPSLQRDFATVALNLLIDALTAESDQARSEMLRAQRPQKLMSWSRAVDRYVEHLVLLEDDLRLGLPVALSVQPDQTVVMAVADRRVLLTHPRADHQSAYEQAVLADFCGRQHCRQLTLVSAAVDPVPLSVEDVATAWSFTYEGPLCSARSLHLQFGPQANLGRARGLCRQLFAEIALFYRVIAGEQRHGVYIAWQDLSLTVAPGRSEHLVQLNARGDSIIAALPLLYTSEGLLAQTVPWGRAVLAGETGELTLHSSDYDWQGL